MDGANDRGDNKGSLMEVVGPLEWCVRGSQTRTVGKAILRFSPEIRFPENTTVISNPAKVYCACTVPHHRIVLGPRMSTNALKTTNVRDLLVDW